MENSCLSAHLCSLSVEIYIAFSGYLVSGPCKALPSEFNFRSYQSITNKIVH
jgi:hypothetical protein